MWSLAQGTWLGHSEGDTIARAQSHTLWTVNQGNSAYNTLLWTERIIPEHLEEIPEKLGEHAISMHREQRWESTPQPPMDLSKLANL